MDKTALLEKTTTILGRLNRKIRFIQQNIEGIDASSMFYKLHNAQIGRLRKQSAILQQYATRLQNPSINQQPTVSVEHKLQLLNMLRMQPSVRKQMSVIIDKHVHRLQGARQF